MDAYRNTKRIAKLVLWVITLTTLYLTFYPYNEWWGVTVTLLYTSLAFIIPVVVYFGEVDKEQNEKD